MYVRASVRARARCGNKTERDIVPVHKRAVQITDCMVVVLSRMIAADVHVAGLNRVRGQRLGGIIPCRHDLKIFGKWHSDTVPERLLPPDAWRGVKRDRFRCRLALCNALPISSR